MTMTLILVWLYTGDTKNIHNYFAVSKIVRTFATYS